MLQISQQRYGKLLILRAVQTPINKETNCITTVSCKASFTMFEKPLKKSHSHCLKITVAFKFWNFGFSTNFCPIKSDLSGNTVAVSKLHIFKNSSKWTIFGIFLFTFVHSKCKRSSLRSQC